MSCEELARRCGCRPEDLIAGKVAVLEEIPPSPALPEGKYRLIFDATKPHVNNKTKVLDQVDFPGAPEVEHLLAWALRCAKEGRPLGFL